MVKRVRYFLNENYKAGDALMLEAYAISRDKEGKGALIVQSPLQVLERYVRSKQVPKGILDWEIVDITSQPPTVLESSEEFFNTPVKKVTHNQLMTKKREDLVKTAKIFGISGAQSKSDEFLRRRIIEESEKLGEDEEEPTPAPKKKGTVAIPRKEDAQVIVEDDDVAPDTTDEGKDVQPVSHPNTPE